MKKKLVCFFLFFFFIVLTMGCIGNGENDVEKREKELITTILINGRESNSLEFVSGQSAEIGLNVKNFGTEPIENVTVRMIGCLDDEAINNQSSEILPNIEHYFNWRVEAIDMGRGERIDCSSFLRVCFDYNTLSKSDVIVIPEDHGTPQSPYSITTGDYLDVIYNIGVTRFIRNRKNEIVGNIIIRKMGPGSVDYPEYIDNPSRNILREIKIEIRDIDGAVIEDYGELKGERLEPIRESDTNLIINYQNDVVRNNLYLLRLIGGNELRSRIVISIPEEYSDLYQDRMNIGSIELDINYGYCIDTTPIYVTMRG